MLSDKENVERRALHNFSTAFLINFIFGIFGTIFSFIFVGVINISMGPSPPVPDHILYTFIMVFVINVIGIVIYLYYLWNGFNLMENIVSDSSIGKIGSILLFFSLFIYPGLILLIKDVMGLPNPPLGPLFALIMIMSGLGIIGIIGLILVVIGLFKIGDYYDTTIIKVGAILLIFLPFIGAIILFIGFRDIEHNPPKHKSVVLPPPPSW